MSLTPIPSAHALQSNPAALKNVLAELQGVNVTLVDGAAAGTAMAIPGIRQEDTILAAIAYADTWAAPTDDKANITIQPTTASATLTFNGAQTEGETLVVNGNTYTFRAVPVKMNDVLIAGTDAARATALANAINAYESRYESQLNGDGNRTAAVVATANGAVVTVRSIVDGNGNAPIVTGTVTVLAAAGSATGSATLTAASVVADNTAVINGVTFTAKATPTLDTHFALKGTNILQAAELARAINAYEFKYGTLRVKASSGGTAVVTITPSQAPTGNAISISESASNLTVSGSGYLAGGTNTGSIKSTTNLSTATLVVHWFNKR